ncbi:GNAT family N-acetyltransferase [Halalkalicoccus jeotgali]|uniref:Acetyltransferase n=1 Tax=Halalkalicoccus jeotgali (strain DSM 18796 / CECT 7217 / JCM 14584 / KCTC 4019 / B3) TaxID=795797 RepID=D8J4R3_HALJB|nr:GNAT family N-acetyltransferase [Halalkalicoccus jeotgali]ADJ15530.1 putative acetyltransferase [Halalkalicoccus jeotgali B3]ELY36061.1 putative acetyltransferase [Halalkalicoccus jeotgali B3]
MNVREADGDDVAGIRGVARRSWETDYPEILSRETIAEGVEEWYASDRLAFDIASDDAHVLVASGAGDEGVIGFAHAVGASGTGTLLRLYVDPDRRDAGVGTRLLETACDRLAAAGCTAVEAMVLAENEPGNAFYHGFGFEPVREGETAIGDEPHEEIVYVLTL